MPGGDVVIVPRMSRSCRWWLLAVLFIATPVLAQIPEDLILSPVADALQDPILVTHAGDGSGRLFVVEQSGRILIIEDGQVLATPFLDISAAVQDGGERGLLGLAFHPTYAQNGRFYVNYTARENGDLTTRVSRFQVSANPDVANPASESVLLRVTQPDSNHNGGHLAFGPDDYLYIAMGDGGGSNDTFRTAQDLGSLLGSLLRIDVDGGTPYAIPSDNPLLAVDGARGEIWAYGLRNPWRYSFDRLTGDLWIGDVGQVSREEVDLQLVGDGGGQNYGWPCREGTIANPGAPTDVDCPAPLEEPVMDYPRGEGRSITGGYRYRGSIPGLRGVYVFGDFISGRIWFATPDNGRWERTLWQDTALLISSFGEDQAGELYVVDHGGEVYRLESPSQGALHEDGFE